MIVTLPSSAQAQRSSVATAAEPNAAVAAASPVVGRTLETVGRGPHSALGFIGELQRIGAALALPLPLLSQKPLAEQALRTSDDAQAPDRADETARSEALLAAMQLHAIQLSASQPLVAAAPVSPVSGEIAAAPGAGLVRVDSMIKTSGATLSGELASGMVAQTVSTQPLVTASPVLQAVVSPKSAPVEKALAPSTGLIRAASLFQTSRATASLQPFVGGTASSSTPHTRAVVANSDALAAMGALSPEAVAVRERSVGHSIGTQTADSLAQAVSASNSDTSVTQAVSAPVSGSATRTPQALMDALGERIEWQLKTGSERAVIRLDPPMQGQLEITIRRDGGVIQVHLNATHSDVVKQLQAIGDTLRQDLAGRQSGDVVVVVSHHNPGGREGDGRGRQPGQTPEQAEPGRALAEAESGQSGARFALSKSL